MALYQAYPGVVQHIFENRQQYADAANRLYGDAIDYRLRQRIRRNVADDVISKRRRVDPVPEEAMAGVGGEGGYINDVHYKRKRRLGRVTVRKLAKVGTKALYDRWQRMGLYGSGNGNLWLSRTTAGTLAEDGLTNLPWDARPYYLFDLTATRNSVNGTENVPEMAWQLCSQNGTFAFNHIRGQNIGTGQLGNFQNSSRYQYYETPRGSAVVDAPLDQAVLDWVKVQAVFWGSKKQSHKIFVDICQMEPWMQPLVVSDGLPAMTALKSTITSIAYNEEGDQQQAYIAYTNQLATLVDSPFATFAKQGRNPKIRILDRKVIEFSPVTSIEENGAAVPHKKTLNLFLNMGRKLNYSWENDNANTFGVLDNPGVETDIERGMHSVVVHPKARIFLRIMAQNYISGESVDYAPSFDLRISRKLIVDGM